MPPSEGAEASPFGVLLISGGHARAHYAFVLATAAAALGRETVLFATNDGVHALGRDLRRIPDFEDEEARLARAGVARLEELREAACELGIRLIACEAGLRSAGLGSEELLETAEIAGVATLLAATRGGQIVTI